MKLAVIGHPIAHSLSPGMHRAALAALGRTDVTYEAIVVAPDDLASFVRTTDLDGFNVTLPHKQAVMALLDEVDVDAQQIGAVNTVVRRAHGLVGSNTDAPGLQRSLAEHDVRVEGAHVLVLGTGGAARATLAALARAKARYVTVAARRPLEATYLVRELGIGPTELASCPIDRLRTWVRKVTLVVQATSATLDAEAAEPFAESLPWSAFRKDTTVVDLVYRPRRTAVLRHAEAHGLRTVEGVGMLVHQGACALETWLGVPAPVEVMRAAVLDALAEDEALRA